MATSDPVPQSERDLFLAQVARAQQGGWFGAFKTFVTQVLAGFGPIVPPAIREPKIEHGELAD